MTRISTPTAARRGMAVRRWHTQPIVGEQTVGEHTANMIAMAFWLLEEPSNRLLYAIAVHDVAECITGDMPAMAKRGQLKNLMYQAETDAYVEMQVAPPTADLFYWEMHVLKALDALELCYFCTDQMMLGNKNMREALYYGLTVLGDASRNLKDEAESSARKAYSKLLRVHDELMQEYIRENS